MIGNLAAFVACIAVASAAQSSFNEYLSQASVAPTVSSFSERYSSPYTYVTYYSHHKEYIYTYETCSSPPSSIEVCLSSIFSSIEAELVSIEATLKAYEASLKSEMHYEHEILSSEISWVAKVSQVAYSVRSVVGYDNQIIYSQVFALSEEGYLLEDIYINLHAELEELIAYAENVQAEKNALYRKYRQVRVAKWSIYSAISEIVSQRNVIQEEEAEIEEVVAKLNVQLQAIQAKIGQLNKRQAWLASWENRLNVDLSAFQKNVVKFRNFESNLEAREKSLYEQQGQLKLEAEAVLDAVNQLKQQYSVVVKNLNGLQINESELSSLRESIDQEASVFISAYEDFTCQDSLLYYEACSSSSVSSSASTPVAVSVSVSSSPAVSVAIKP